MLGDQSHNRRPLEFGYELFDWRIQFSFAVVKLLDLAQHWQTFSQNPNPFATVVMAHLKANQTPKDRQQQLQWKLTLTR